MSTSGSHDGSETAEYINSFVGSCTHDRTPAAHIDALAAAQELITAASHCLDAARSLIKAHAHRDLVEDYLAQSESAAAEATELLSHALSEEEFAEEAEAAASAAAAAAGVTTSLSITGLAEHARNKAGEAKSLVEGETSRTARVLKDRCDDIRNTARTLLLEFQ